MAWFKLSIGFTAIVVLLGSCSLVTAQTSRYNVEGVVTDTSDVTLAGATVVLLNSTDSTIVSFGTTRSDGLFRLRRIQAGNYTLQVSFVGFEQYIAEIEIIEENLNVGSIPLKAAVSELDALVITADYIPILINKDTLEYNAGAFNVRPNANVEELLKRLPGVDVERDGTIRAQGEEVEQVLVDGKEFFGNDPRIATQNLPADAVDKVQVYDKKSDMAEFSGVDDGEESKTINLALKEDSKQGYFGNTSGGYGSDNIRGRYEGRLSMNRFSPSTQLSLIGNLNNVNQQGFSMGDYMSFMGGMMGGGFSRASLPLNMGVTDGFSMTTAAGVNFNRDFGAKTSLQSSYFLNVVDNDQNRLVNQQQLIGSQTSSRSLQASDQDISTQNHRLNLNLKHEINKGQDLRLRADLRATDSGLYNDSFRELNSGANVLVNDNNTLYKSDGLDFGGSASLTYRKKLSERGRTLVAEGRAEWNDGSMKGDLETLNFFYDNIGNVVSSEELRQFQDQQNTTSTNRQQISWTEPLGRSSSLQVRGERRQRVQDQDKRIYDLREAGSVLNESLSAGLEQTYTYNEAGLNVRFNPGGASYSIGVDVQSSDLEGDVRGSTGALTRSFVDFLPSARFSYDFANGKRMDIRYETTTREPSMNELQPFADNTDPLFVYVGNPDLEPEYRHSGRAHFMMFDQFSSINLFGYFQAQYTQDKIARDRTIDAQLRQSITSRNVDGDWMLRGRLDYGMPLRPLGIRVNLSTESMYNRGKEFINDAENQTRILRQSIDLRINNRNNEIIDALIGAKYTFNTNKYSLNPELGRNYVNRTFYTEINYYMGDHWRFTSGFDYRLFADEVFGSGQQIPIWRAEISRLIMGDKAEVQLVGLDLLNQNLGVNYSNTSTYIQEERIQTLGRYVMLKFVYNLSGLNRRGGNIQVIGN
ncbi:MAG: outer membrane beta-barrel protein [Rhodothermaceae bacterium]|nr:outer membrane beta-barrel protein [Rhodothermaceae bacterium]